MPNTDNGEVFQGSGRQQAGVTTQELRVETQALLTEIRPR